MKSSTKFSALALLLALSSGVSYSDSPTEGSPIPILEDQILVTQATIPPGIAHTVLGPVQVARGAGYDKVESLYPILAVRAKALGANAVVETRGGHRVRAFSWAAPYVSGIAVKIEDPKQRSEMPGLYY